MSDAMTNDAGDPVPVGDPVMTELRKRYQRSLEFEAVARTRFLEDIKFGHADSDNGYQWPNHIRRARDVASRPCLTMNITRQHNLQIINDARQSPAVISIRPVGNGATKQAADMFHALTRYIEHQSGASAVYAKAREFQVFGGIGWWRLVTEYENENSFNQEIRIRPVNDPMSIFYDPASQLADKTDSQYMIVFDVVPKDEFREAYPRFAHLASLASIGIGEDNDSDWNGKGMVRICEYFRKVMKRDQLISFIGVDGQRKQLKRSMMPEDGLDELLEIPTTRIRDVFEEVIEWKLVVGQKVIDETIWPGKYIPLIPVIGEEIIIDGIMDRKGHTRAMKDSQRMFNYNASSQVEFVALQTKTPWVAPVKAIEEYEQEWGTANQVNHSVLPYNHVDDEGNPIPPPTRNDPPAPSAAFDNGMQNAFQQMMMVSGQWQNQMGMQGNERTGSAIARRQEQGDTATFHFRDNYEAALVTTGNMLIDLIPKIYDTKRVLLIQAEDGADLELVIDPGAKKAFELQQMQDQETARAIFNPNIGKYWVVPQPGAPYGTRREETVQAMTLLLTQAPQLGNVIGDLLLASMDFKEAQEAAQRLRRMVPPQALGTGPSEQEQLLQQQVVQLTNALQKALLQSGKDAVKLLNKAELRDIGVYDAETRRMAALKDALALDPEGLRAVVQQLVQESSDTSLNQVSAANRDDLEASTLEADEPGAPVPGAKRAPDGHWYLADPTRPGQWLQVLERE